MALSNSQLVDRFAAGRKSGQSNRMEITQVGALEYDDVDGLPNAATCVVGFGWAVYAARLPDGTVVVYKGWKDWTEEVGQCAAATPQHIRALETVADVVSDDKPQAADAPGELVHQLKHGKRQSVRY